MIKLKIRNKLLIGFLLIIVISVFFLVIINSFIDRVKSLSLEILPISVDIELYQHQLEILQGLEDKMDLLLLVESKENKEAVISYLAELKAQTSKIVSDSQDSEVEKSRLKDRILELEKAILKIIQYKGLAMEEMFKDENKNIDINKEKLEMFNLKKNIYRVQKDKLSSKYDKLEGNVEKQKILINNIYINSIVRFFVYIVIAIIISYVLSSSLSRPINILTKKMINIAREKGTLEKLVVKSNDEIGELSSAFNDIIFYLEAMNVKLLTANTTLQEEIAARKEIEHGLAKEKEMLFVTLYSISEGVISTDNDANIVLINNSALALTGFEKEQAIGMKVGKVFKIIQEKSQEPYEGNISAILNEKIINNKQLNRATLISKDGTERIVSHSTAPIRDMNGNIIGTVLVFSDITEKQKMANELDKALRLESLGILAGGIAHDFNNLLGSIFGNISLAQIEEDKNTTISNYLSKTVTAIQRARELTQQLLTFAKGGAPIKKAASIKKLVMESVDLALSGSNILPKYKIQKSIRYVEVDAGQINQVLNNIIINARQAMPNGGVINIELKDKDISQKNKLQLNPGKYVEILIKDYGHGIMEKYLNKIFDPFFTTKKMGSGLGLSTSYSIIKKHDGQIAVESEEGKGTTFYIYLPTIEDDITEETTSQKPLTKMKGNILIMDDDMFILEILKGMISVLGFSVESAKDGLEVIKKYKEAIGTKKAYHVIIMDLTVPNGMGGEQAITELLAIDPNVKAIISSGYSNSKVLANFREYGFKAMVRKPFSIEELSSVLTFVLNNTN